MINHGFETTGDVSGGESDVIVDVQKLMTTIRFLDGAIKSHLSVLEPSVNNDKAKQQKNMVNSLAVASIDDMAKSAADPTKRNDKVTVFVRVLFMKINGIDTIHDRYNAEVMIQNRWREPKLDGCKLVSENIDWEDYWNPKLSIENAIGEPKEMPIMTFSLDSRGRATVCETRRVAGNFFEFMELNKFPFDSQDLTITLASERNTSELQLVEYTEQKSGVSTEGFSAEQEWRVSPAVNVWTKVNTKKIHKATIRFPALSVAAKATRKPQFFIWNIFVVMFLVCALAFASFTCSLSSPQSRLQLTFILLLTTVTFKFAVNKNLPRIPYLTLLDKYIIGVMLILFSCCVWHAVVGAIIQRSTYVAKQEAAKAAATTKGITFRTTATAMPTTMAVTAGSNSTRFSSNLTTRTLVQAVTTLTTDWSTSMFTDSANDTDSSASDPDAPTPKSTLADYVVLGIFLSVYMVFHLVFAVLIFRETTSENLEPNIDVNVISSASDAETTGIPSPAPLTARSVISNDLKTERDAKVADYGDLTANNEGTTELISPRPMSSGPVGRRASARLRSARSGRQQFVTSTGAADGAENAAAF